MMVYRDQGPTTVKSDCKWIEMDGRVKIQEQHAIVSVEGWNMDVVME